MRVALISLAAAFLAACGPTPKPFEHDRGSVVYRATSPDIELAVAPPANMPIETAWRVASAVAVELQSYGVLAAVQPTTAPRKLGAVTAIRPTETGVEIELSWYLDSGGQLPDGPAISVTRARAEEYAQGQERLISRIAQQAAPRIATLMGRPPNFQPRAPGQIAAGVMLPEAMPAIAPPPSGDPARLPAAAAPAAAASGAVPQAAAAPPPSPPPGPAPPKARVAPVTGAPSDGNRQLQSGMRKALGTNRVVLSDAAGPDVFTVLGTVSLQHMDDRRTRLTIKWVLQDPSGKQVGDLEQSNPVPTAATQGSWTGFAEIVTAAAAEGILELLRQAASRPR